ncbi:MAG: hypothetical protein ACK5LS_10610 [Propioniciclava sp.]
MTSRDLLHRIVILMVAAVVAGAVAAFLWSRVTALPVFAVEDSGHATITELGMAQIASADWWFAVIGVVVGAGLGYGTWRLLRSVGWPVAFLTVGVALIAGVTCWLLGEAFGPSPFDVRISSAEAGDLVPVALTLHARSALALWPFAAVAVPLFAASLGPEVEPEPEPSRVSEVDSGAPLDATGSR